MKVEGEKDLEIRTTRLAGLNEVLESFANIAVACAYSKVIKPGTVVTPNLLRAGMAEALADTRRHFGIPTPASAPEPENPRRLQLDVY